RWIHFHRDPDNLFKTVQFQMSSIVDQLADSVEPLHISLFSRQKRKHSKVGENLLHQIPNIPNLEFDGFVRSIRSNETASPSFLNDEEEIGSICVLTDRKARSDLPTKPVSPTRLKGNAKAAFTVYKSRDVRSDIHGKNQGRRLMKPESFIQGAQP